MSTVLKSVRPLPDYQLELEFQNGSRAIVNMKKRVRTLRFSRLSSPELFATGRAAGDKVEWSDGRDTISVYCSELLDSMLLD